MTTNPPGNDSGTPIHDRTAASEGNQVHPGVTVPSFASGTPAPRPADPDTAQTYDPYGEHAAEVPFDPDLDAVPADEQLPATPTTATPTTLPPTGSAPNGGGSGKADAAKGAAQDVAGDAKDKAANVAGTAKEQASNVASEATDHTKQLYGQATETLKEQAADQQQRAAGGLRSIGEQLGRMAENDDEQGVASKVVRDLSSRATSAAGFLENRDPGSLLDEVKHFAAKRPGTFIAVAAGAGLLAGRLAKALATEVKHEKEADDGATGTTGTGSGV
ncbi:hypothetical protein [Curtobacterium sp. PhB115]|uniref:hypothetical protein n=1 Tax=Curtobacterium sp. PhB115 TaxID=2485173 RepID=UPI000F4C3E41|nr:hypothetical protein [Curtobacterium sp. PhB115]ROP74998.1 hypothetical protein EDF19_1087 [Curtobacterium sp. PhB115]